MSSTTEPNHPTRPHSDAGMLNLPFEFVAEQGTKLVKIPLEVLQELISVTRSVNRGRQHEVRLGCDDEPYYWQTKEWVEWAVETGELAATELVRVNQSSRASAPKTEQEGTR